MHPMYNTCQACAKCISILHMLDTLEREVTDRSVLFVLPDHIYDESMTISICPTHGYIRETSKLVNEFLRRSMSIMNIERHTSDRDRAD